MIMEYRSFCILFLFPEDKRLNIEVEFEIIGI